MKIRDGSQELSRPELGHVLSKRIEILKIKTNISRF